MVPTTRAGIIAPDLAGCPYTKETRPTLGPHHSITQDLGKKRPRERKMELLKASVQYGDWKGTAAADDADSHSLEHYLREKGLSRPEEFVIATSLWVSEGFISIRAFLLDATNYETEVQKRVAATTGPIPARELHLQLTLPQFVALFKRFNVMLTWPGLEGRELDVVQE